MLVLAEQILTLLREELSAYQQLDSLLQAEQEALKLGDIEQLEHSTQAKSAVVQLLAVSVQQRQQLFTSNPVLTDNGLEHFLSLYARPEDQDIWEELLKQAAAAQEANQLNGLLIQQLGLQTQKAIAVLQGQNPDADGLYDTRGQNTLSKRQRTIIS